MCESLCENVCEIGMVQRMKYLKKRGNWYHFERIPPPDVQHLINPKEWRHTLNTDSKVDAEDLCRRRTVETDEQLKQARNGTYRRLVQTEVKDLAAQWSIDFQLINRENIAREAFPDVWGELEAIGDEAPRPIIRKRADLTQYVRDWLDRTNAYIIESDTPDFEALLDACLDEYLVSNPEISSGHQEVLDELEVLPNGYASTFDTLKRKKKIDPNRKLSNVFKRYLQINTKIGESARSDFGTSVRRFIEFHGDMDVSEIDRSHVEQFRDAVIQLPVRPPNTIRSQPIKQQIAWADKIGAKTIKQGAMNKNLMGVKRTLEFAFEETSLIQDRNWRNPFDGFSKPVGQPENPVEPFTTAQLQLVFSDQIFVTKTAERFWIPLLLFYTGARLDEVSQLHVTDIVMEPVPHILAENLEDEDPALAKKLKTLSSHRTIPIHNGLIELGFFQYVGAVRDLGHRHLFPNLPHARGKNRGGYTSRTFMRAFRKYGEHNPTSGLNTLSLRTHSLRHSYRIAGYEVPDQEFVQIVMGHYVGGDSVQTYGPQIYRMPHILHQRVTSLIPLAGLDMEYLRTEAKRHLNKIQTA